MTSEVIMAVELMNARERWLETLLFGQADRCPLQPGGGRESTLARWHSEGLPEDVRDVAEYAYRMVGGTQDWPVAGEGFYVSERMIPEFEEKVLEERERTLIVQDWKGNICEISNAYSVEYLRNPIDFVTRRWIKCPVSSRADWHQMRQRYDAEDPHRLPADAASKAMRLANRSHPLGMSFPGPFWQLREWLGFESLCMLFHDDPEWVAEMIDFWEHFVSRLLARAFKYVKPDYVRICEDMAYKGFSMLSPAMIRQFLLPTWKRWGDLIRQARCPVYYVDSDGFMGELIPIWIEAGVNVCEPVEVAAGCDVVQFRREFGDKMAYVGGVDKRLIAAGGTAIEEEINRLRAVIEQGGFIPSCDHGIPADVSWRNFVYYVKLLAQATGWL